MADAHITNVVRDGDNRPFAAHGHAVLATAGAASLLRGEFEPGWRWSTDIAPIAGTSSCQVRHLGYVISGRMDIRMDDGKELTCAPGDLFDLAPGHDAWVVGDEKCVMVDFSPDATRYARGATQITPPAPDANMDAVRRGYAAFNTGDIETLSTILARDVVQQVPGQSQLAGTYKGLDAVLGYYGKLGELTDGTFRAGLLECHSDSSAHVTAVHQITATRNGVTMVTRGSILFTFLGGKATDLLEMHANIAADDAFFA
jgi:ketosteroid isomerase-like protein